jgi:hypothetical protein
MTTPEQATVNKRQKEWATHAQFAADAVAQWPKWKQAFAVQFLCQLGCDDAITSAQTLWHCHKPCGN